MNFDLAQMATGSDFDSACTKWCNSERRCSGLRTYCKTHRMLHRAEDRTLRREWVERRQCQNPAFDPNSRRWCIASSSIWYVCKQGCGITEQPFTTCVVSLWWIYVIRVFLRFYRHRIANDEVTDELHKWFGLTMAWWHFDTEQTNSMIQGHANSQWLRQHDISRANASTWQIGPYEYKFDANIACIVYERSASANWEVVHARFHGPTSRKPYGLSHNCEEDLYVQSRPSK